MVSSVVKNAMVLVLGVSLLILFLINAVPSMLGNDAFTVWVGGTNYAWIATILVFVLLIGAALKAVNIV